MSKRGMESQGGSERYGHQGGPPDGPEDKPKMATAAQLAQRKIKEAKRKTPRGSRAGSPAVAVAGQGPTGANPFQSFQPPPSADSFNFSMPGFAPAPSFGQSTPQQNGGMSIGNQPNGTPSFGGFGNSQTNGAPSFGSNNTQPQTNGFQPTASFTFGTQTQPNTASTPGTSFSFGQTPAQSQEQPRQNGFNPSTTSMFGGSQPQQPYTNGEQAPKPHPFAGVFGSQVQTKGAAPAVSTGMFGSTPAPAVTAAPVQSVFGGFNASSASSVRPGMFSNTQAPPDGARSQAQTPQSTFSFAPPPPTNGQAQAQVNGEQYNEPQNPVFSFGQTSQQNTFDAPSQSRAPETEKPAMKFGFGHQQRTNGDHGADAGRPSNPFAGVFGQSSQGAPETAKKASATSGTDMFGGAGEQNMPETPFKFGQSQSQTQQTPMQNILGSVAQPQTNGVAPSSYGAAQQEDTSMLTPRSTPHSQNLATSQSEQSHVQQQPEAETPANPNAGKSMFDRILRDPPTTVTKPLYSFGSVGASADSQAEPTPNPNAGKSLFERMTPRDPQPPAAAPRGPAAPTFSVTAPTPTASDKPARPTQRSGMSEASSTDTTAAPDRRKLKMLNEGILSHLNNEDPDQDWSRIMQFYVDQAAKLMGPEAVKAPVAPAQASRPAISSPATDAARPPPTGAASETPSSVMFGGSSSQPGMVHARAPAPPGHSTRAPQPATPHPSATNVFSQTSNPPATAPVNKKRSTDEDPTKRTAFAEPPATEKRSKPNTPIEYPNLPDTASNTAKLFASTLDKPAPQPAASSPNFGPSNDLMTKVREQKAAKEAAQRADRTEKAAPTPSAFKPSTKINFGASTASSPAPKQPADISKAPAFGFKPAPAAATPSGTTQTPAFKPSTKFNFEAFAAPASTVEKPAETPQAPSTAFKPSTKLNFGALAEKPAEAPGTPSFGFTPAPAADKLTFTPTVHNYGFKPPPSASAGGPDFLSAFGKKAETSIEDAKRERMNADYDSDDEDKATWEARDQAVQEVKRQKIEEAVRSAPFGFKPALAEDTSAPTSAPTFGFKPTAAPAGGANFLSVFGQKAEKSVEEAKRKRMEEDYDSDEDEDEAAWEARDRTTQEAKRRKIEEAVRSASFGFKPTLAEDTAPTSAPILGFKPTSAPPGGANFLSVFGQQAEKSVEEAKRKRMEEDHDSDDDGDEAAWEARDRATQEAKRQKIEEAAKSAPGFGFPLTATSDGAGKAPFAFKLPGTDKPAETSTEPSAEETAEAPNPNAGKSMFDRITFPAKAPSTTNPFAAQTPSKDSTATNFSAYTKGGALPAIKFGEGTPAKNADTNTTQGQGSKTWDPSTPIKLGASKGAESTTPAAAPPTVPFGGLFGGSAAAGSSSKLAPPTVGFTFGAPKGVSADVSRATSPGVTTDGEASVAGDGAEGADGEPSDQPSEKQVEDMTTLMDEEREAEDVLFEVPLAKTMKLSRNDGGASSWEEKGKGPLYILKNKSTGRTRVVMKIAPLGRLAMNFSPLKDFKYTCAAGKRVMQATFMDHLDKGEMGRPSLWTIQVKEAKDAQVIARILEKEKL